MSRIVVKYGGTSLATTELISKAAERVAALYREDNEVLVVVSAMAGVTNQLVDNVNNLGESFDLKEYDTVVSSGEQATSGLMAIALQALGVPARSWQGWQVPIETNAIHKNAQIQHIDPAAMIADLTGHRRVAVCSGFQGVSPERRIATLGRSGSDTSAVALACAVQADECIIYTDVDGIFTADPRVVADAHPLEQISYEEILELSYLGAKVIHNRAVTIAMAYNLPLWVRSSFGNSPGTLITAGGLKMEGEVVRGVTCSQDEAKVVLAGIEDTPGRVASIFKPLAEAGINVDMIVQNATVKQTTEVTFTVPLTDVVLCEKILQNLKDTIGFAEITVDRMVSKISVVGIGMRSNSGVAAKAFEALAELGINIQAIATSEIKITVLIDSKFSELAVRALHARYELDKIV